MHLENHTNFTHLIKLAWLSKCPQWSRRNRDHDSAIKNLILKYLNRDWSYHHSLLWKTIEKSKLKWIRTRFKIWESVTCGEGISTHNSSTKTVPLIKWIEKSVVLQNIIFLKKKRK